MELWAGDDGFEIVFPSSSTNSSFSFVLGEITNFGLTILIADAVGR